MSPLHVDLDLLLMLGPLLVLLAALALALLVRRDLLPLGPQAVPRPFLVLALGMGIFAFAVKLAVIALLSTFPTQTIARHIPPPRLAQPAPAPPQTVESRPLPWRSLPRQAPAAADNPITPAKVALGARLFADPALSRDGSLSCASCHDLEGAAGADGRPTARGIEGQVGARNTPSVYNAAFLARLFWDGRAATLEEQAIGPLLNPLEMGMPSAAAVEARVETNPVYPPLFAAAFGPEEAISLPRIAQALAAFQRTLITPDSPYDRFVAGDLGALSTLQQRGMWLFRQVGCATCHAGPAFSGASLIGPRLPFASFPAGRSPTAAGLNLGHDPGRNLPGAAIGLWRVPSLRNVALTAPYFHNGAVPDLRTAVRIMAEAQLGAKIIATPAAAPRLWWSTDAAAFTPVTGRRQLSPQDIDAIVAFLQALSSDRLVTLRAESGR